ncbi:hypothetical protein [Nonomuraea typhae]|uniref:hypothetical protein n=1 Tax=Nonomuraea typhae TaxID=2603600 RepID=UPI0012FC4962|nr:hypothetical protein [Nonomuraea typhae]
MKRTLIAAGGFLLAAGLTTPALAGATSSDPAAEALAKDAREVSEVLKFWTASNNAALRQATALTYDYKAGGAAMTGGYTADGKPGLVAPIGGEKKKVAKSYNVNFPKTIGKVFFVNAKGGLNWCSATSIQSQHRNLVATAGNCVYDEAGNGHVMDKWVFVPAFYQGKTPYGIFVGKTAYLHYDYANYEDGDRNYAFVTVYNGLNLGTGKTTQVNKAEFDKFVGDKWVDEKEITKAEYDAGVDKYGKDGPYKSKIVDPKTETVAKPAGVNSDETLKPYLAAEGKDGIKAVTFEVTEGTYTSSKKDYENNSQFASETVPISKEDYERLLKEKASGNFPGKVEEVKDGTNVIGWKKTTYWLLKWVKSSTKTVYYVEQYFIRDGGLVSTGRLGDAVGGQGFAYNQPVAKSPVRVFGYPYAEHPDGNKAYTGITPKTCYGKTSAKNVTWAKYRIEENVALKCAMTPGADGGPWLLKYSNATRLGYVNGVTGGFLDTDSNGRIDHSISAYFDGETNSVYRAAEKNWSGDILPGIKKP